MNVSETKFLEVWVAEDSPFYRLVVEEAIEEISKVTDQTISLTVFERFGDICSALEEAEQGLRQYPSAALSDLHFPDNSHDHVEDMLMFYSRHMHRVPLSYMSCNLESLELAEHLSNQIGKGGQAEGYSESFQSPRFLRKDTAETMINLVKTIHDMVFTPRVHRSFHGTTLVSM